MIRMLSELESNIVAVERVKEYSKTKTEVGTGMGLGLGESAVAGEGCSVAHCPGTPKISTQVALRLFIHPFNPY